MTAAVDCFNHIISRPKRIHSTTTTQQKKTGTKPRKKEKTECARDARAHNNTFQRRGTTLLFSGRRSPVKIFPSTKKMEKIFFIFFFVRFRTFSSSFLLVEETKAKKKKWWKKEREREQIPLSRLMAPLLFKGALVSFLFGILLSLFHSFLYATLLVFFSPLSPSLSLYFFSCCCCILRVPIEPGGLYTTTGP